MRTTSLAILALTTASLVAGKPTDAEGGSIEALLERISQRNNHTTAASARVSAVPEQPRNETQLPPTPPPAPKEEKAADESVPAPKEAHKHESKRSAHTKMAKRVRAKAEEENAKRWVWATGIIQDDTPASAAPAVGQNANQLSSNAAPVGTPAAALTPPSFPPQAAAPTTTPAAASTTPAHRPSWKTRQPANRNEQKRWVWVNSIIQDDTPASQAPAVGQNVNQLNTPAVNLNTPAANLAAPSFPPKQQVATPVVEAVAASTTSRAARLHWYKAPQARGLDEHEEEKRWVWGNSIIQDDTPASEAPAVGENANNFASATYAATTPAATLVAPTFPPKSSSQTPAPSPAPSSSAAAVIDDAVVSAHAVSVTSALPSVVTSSAAAAHSTSPAHHWWNPKVLLHDIEEGFDKLFHIHQSSSVTAAPVQTGDVQKRWVWSNQIIQDDSPDAPAVGENANLLTGATYGANTPAANLVAPSFPPKAAAAASSTTTTTSAAAQPTHQVLAAAGAAVSSSSAAPKVAAAPATTSAAPVTNARQTWQQAHEAALAAAAAKKAAAAHTTTTKSSSSAKASATKSAAQQWFKAEPKEKRMVKRERK
ncbi:hypothetical protein JCM8097_001105 [Rhodosporidiobolus ruineniae]